MDIGIGQEIVIRRAQKGWTQQQLAEAVQTSQRTVAAWEAGDSVPRKTMQVRLARVFDLEDNYFLMKQGEKSREQQIDEMMQQIERLLTQSKIFEDRLEKEQTLNRFRDVLNQRDDTTDCMK